MSKITPGQRLYAETTDNNPSWHRLNANEQAMWEARAAKQRKLTSRMEQAILQLLKASKPLSAYEIGGASLATMRALEERGMVGARHELGSMAFPHTSIKWRLTESGKREAERIARR